MNIPESDGPRVNVTPGSFASNKLSSVPHCHPFTLRLDVLFPENAALEVALAQHKTRYAKGVFRLSELVENASAFIHEFETHSKFLMLSTDKNIDDVWCIDSRGLVTLFLSKETYEQLGIAGKPLPFKKRAKHDRVVQFSLRRGTDTPGNVARRHVALRAWDKRREEEMGVKGWHVMYCCKDPGTISHPLFASGDRLSELNVEDVASQLKRIRDVHVPNVELRWIPGNGAEDELEDWNEEMHSLFEWVGMACLGSQRINLNDRVDPYVAVYEPLPSMPGNLTHIQWQGFLCPAFVQLVVDTAISFLNTTDRPENAPSFLSVISHSATKTPLSYINPKNMSLVPGRSEALRVPREDGEDSWCLYAKPASPLTRGKGVDWVLAESVDKLVTR
ncbi:hypothetical protein APHAL10511_005245 [Amanita phalloides]|nr:hypothetical protein APHAL10511_005245 [Amanita phalloides]